MMSKHAIIVAFSLSGLSCSEGLGSATSSTTFQVVIPQSLKKPYGFDHRTALFGTFPSGRSIQAPVFYTSNKMCGTAATPPSKGSPESADNTTWDPPYILMVDRGDCSFVTKVRNAEHAGAAAVLIADNMCQCDHVDCIVTVSDQTCQTVEPIMADDGSGGDIAIPSFLLFKEDADAIRATLQSNNNNNSTGVRAEMTFAGPDPYQRVEYEYWSLPGDSHSMEFMENFQRFAVALGRWAQFRPRYSVFDGRAAGCHNDGLDDSTNTNCMTLCTNHGRYCANAPDRDLYFSRVSGSEVVKESLRRICIWSHYGARDGIGASWWDYVHEFEYRCAEGYFSDEDCIQDAYEHAGIDAYKIEMCMRDVGGVEEDRRNSKLDEEIKRQKERGVFLLPTSFVNGAQTKGALTSSSIFKAVCAGYSEVTKPDICSKCALCADVISCVDSKGVCSGGNVNSGGHIPLFTLISSILMLIVTFMGVIFMGVGYWYYKRMPEEMQEQRQGLLSEDMLSPEENDLDTGSGVVPVASSATDDAVNVVT